MKTVRFLAMLWLPFLASGCVSDVIDEGSGTGQNGEIRFEIGFAPQTRVATGADFTSEWEVGDAIGIFAVANGSPLAASGNYIHNVKLTYDKTANKWTPAVPLYWPGSGLLDFYAYYPYDDNGGSPATFDPTAISFSVSADQSASGAFGASELLTSRSNNSGEGWEKGSTVALTFTHSLALVQVDITDREVGVPEYDADYLRVTMQGVQTSATLDLGSTGGAAAGGNPESVIMMRVETGDATEWIYRALVPSQTVAAGAVLFTFEQDVDGDGDFEGDFTDFRFVYAAPQAMTLAAGEYTVFDIETGWGDGNYSAETRRFIQWAQETDDWQNEDFTLFADIDLKGYDWKPVGDHTTQFTRTFDGDGHTIMGFSVNSNTIDVGLFGVVGSGGKVRNVTVSGTVSGTVTGTGYLSHIGGIVGENNGTITDCTFSGTVTGTYSNVGGIVGFNYDGSITGCSVGENSTIEGTGSNSRVGGIAGWSYHSATITGCSFNGTVTGTGTKSRVGGITGLNENGGTITGCSIGENSTIEGTGSNSRVGGIAGSNYYSITECTLSGTVTGSGDYVGGIAGLNGNGGSITGCSVGENSTVTGTGTDSYVGGIAGDNSGTINGSWSAAKRVTGTTVGGIVGENNGDGTIRNCHWLWNDPTGFGGNAVGSDSGTTSGCSSFATVSALNMLIPDMNTAIIAAGITDWQWVEGADPTTDWPTIQKLP